MKYRIDLSRAEFRELLAMLIALGVDSPSALDFAINLAKRAELVGNNVI